MAFIVPSEAIIYHRFCIAIALVIIHLQPHVHALTHEMVQSCIDSPVSVMLKPIEGLKYWQSQPHRFDVNHMTCAI